jgi:hypothetical protein
MSNITKAQIVEALGKLDPTTDEHWTKDGQPALSVVASFIGEGGVVTRKEVIDASPDFSRANPQPGVVEEPFDEEAHLASQKEVRTQLQELEAEVADIDNRIDALRAQRQVKQAAADDLIQKNSEKRSEAATHNIKRFLGQSRRNRIEKVRRGADPRKLAGARERKAAETASA